MSSHSVYPVDSAHSAPASPPAPALASPPGPGSGSGEHPGAGWGVLVLPVAGAATPEALGAKAKALSKAGKLPGYRAGVPGNTIGARRELFAFHAFGAPWDHEVRVMEEAGEGGEGGGTRVSFVPRVLRKSPAIFALLCVLSVWPGAWLTDSMLKAYFPSYSWNTYLWYLPLTIIPIPWMTVKMWRASKVAARAHAMEKIELLRD